MARETPGRAVGGAGGTGGGDNSCSGCIPRQRRREPELGEQGVGPGGPDSDPTAGCSLSDLRQQQ